MEDENLDLLFNLNEKAKSILKTFQNLPEKDIRRVHFGMFSSQIIINHINYKINVRFSEVNKEEFLNIFNSDINQIRNYTYNITQFIAENLISASLFQSELIFRYYYSKLTGNTPSSERNLFKIVALLYNDTENNWQKEECNLIVLLWTLRNTIHTGGIYFENINGRNLTYKGKTYNFEYGKSPKFLINGKLIELISDFFDALNVLFNSKQISDLGFIEHPTINALEK